jgi:hypothetical protein
VTKKMMVTEYIRAQAWWRLDSPGPSAIRVARSVVALLDAAACIDELPEDHPDFEELDRAGCFATGEFDPGEAGLAVVRGWELADQPTGTEQNLLGTLAVTVSADRGVPSPAARHAAAASGAVPAAPLPGGYTLPGSVPPPRPQAPRPQAPRPQAPRPQAAGRR